MEKKFQAGQFVRARYYHTGKTYIGMIDGTIEMPPTINETFYGCVCRTDAESICFITPSKCIEPIPDSEQHTAKNNAVRYYAGEIAAIRTAISQYMRAGKDITYLQDKLSRCMAWMAKLAD